MKSWSAASGPDLEESRPFITQGKLRRVYSDHSLAAQLNHQARHSVPPPPPQNLFGQKPSVIIFLIIISYSIHLMN